MARHLYKFGLGLCRVDEETIVIRTQYTAKRKPLGNIGAAFLALIVENRS